MGTALRKRPTQVRILPTRLMYWYSLTIIDVSHLGCIVRHSELEHIGRSPFAEFKRLYGAIAQTVELRPENPSMR